MPVELGLRSRQQRSGCLDHGPARELCRKRGDFPGPARGFGTQVEIADCRAARNDGWIADLHSLAELEALIAEVRGYREHSGRAAEPFEILAFGCTDAVGAAGYRAMRDIGVTVVSTMPWIYYGVDLAAPAERKIDGIKRFADDVIGKL